MCKWTIHDQDKARYEGWHVVNPADGSPRYIQNDPMKFGTAMGALIFVRHRALQGSRLHERALEYVGDTVAGHLKTERASGEAREND